MAYRWNPQQKEVLEARESKLLVLGAAGTGKTTLIPYCLSSLQAHETALVLVPAQKDARELERRIKDACGSKAKNIKTAHFSGYALSLAKNKRICFTDEKDRQILLKECFQELNLLEKTFSIQAIGLKVRSYKQELLKPHEIQPRDRFERAAKRVYSCYQKKLEELDLYDIEDLYFMALENLATQKESFTLLIGDDYQELCKAQHLFFQALAQRAKRTIIFADPLQNCLGYYGTSSAYVDACSQEIPTIQLTESFVLPRGVLQAAQKLSHASRLNGALDNVITRKEGHPAVYCVRDEHEEAWWVARRILEYCRKGKKYSDFVIFFRNPAQGKCFEEALKQLHIPYRLLLPTPFYEEKEVRDILSYLRVLHNPYDFLALKRVINIPHRGIGSSTLKKMEEKMRKRKMPYYDFFSSEDELEDFSPGVREKFQEVCQVLKRLKTLEKESPSRLIREIKKIISEEHKNEELTALTAWDCFRKEAEVVSRASELVPYLYTLHPFDYHQRDDNHVLLSHIAFNKSSAFEIVFIAGMEEGIFPQRSAILDEKEMEIERKLCYAAMSRAREKVYFLYATNRTLYGGSQRTDVSRFLKDMGLLDQTEKPHETKEKAPRGKVNGELRKGTKVFHKMWGEGEVKKIVGEGDQAMLVINFATVGQKTLLKEYAPLETLA